jgi:superfamily II DNA or RNA helicase
MHYNRLEETLNFLNLNELSRIIGIEILEGLSDLNISITKSSIIEMLLTSRGTSFLSEKEARKILFSKPDVKAFLNISTEISDTFINSSWTKNYEKVANILELDPGEFNEEKSKRKADFISGATETLMPYQNWMRKLVLDKFANNVGKRTLVHMPTGAGKTRTAMQIVFDQIRTRSPKDTTIIWMAHSDELCEQAVQSFDVLWPNQQISTARIWRAWGGLSDLSEFNGGGCNFVVTSFQTLFSWMKSNDNNRFSIINRLKLKTDFLIIDEAHLSTALTYRRVIEFISSNDTNILGLTATPGRHSIGDDGDETKTLSDFFDDSLISMPKDDGSKAEDPISFLQSKGVLSKVLTDTLPGSNVKLSATEIKSCSELLELPELVLKRLGSDTQRTLNVAVKVLELTRERKQVIVFCPSKLNSLFLAEFLKINGCSAASITGDLAMSERHRKLEEFKSQELQVITNFNVLTTGFDAPNIGAVVIARPTLSVVLYSQMIGRGLRGPLFNGTEFTTIINVADNIDNLPSFQSAFTYFNDFFGGETEDG